MKQPILRATLVFSLVMVGGCPRPKQREDAQEAPTSSARPADAPPRAIDARAVQVEAADIPADLPAGKPWAGCDGDLSVEDIPDTPLRAVVGGKLLEPTAMVVRGSILGRSIAFDFALPIKWDREHPCFIAETKLAAGFKRTSDEYQRGLSLQQGNYRLGTGWEAYYSYRTVHDQPMTVTPSFYGLLTLESATGLQQRPAEMFSPTGRLKGKVALCFKDDQESWIAGSFDVPVCGDEP